MTMRRLEPTSVLKSDGTVRYQYHLRKFQSFASICMMMSFHASIGPGKHQCRQSFWTLAVIPFS